jgi:hypothetical protein
MDNQAPLSFPSLLQSTQKSQQFRFAPKALSVTGSGEERASACSFFLALLLKRNRLQK